MTVKYIVFYTPESNLQFNSDYKLGGTAIILTKNISSALLDIMVKIHQVYDDGCLPFKNIFEFAGH